MTTLHKNDKLNAPNTTTPPPTMNNNFQDRLDSLLNLVSGRATGTPNEDSIEDAITDLLRAPTTTNTSSLSTTSNTDGKDDSVLSICQKSGYDPLLRPPSLAQPSSKPKPTSKPSPSPKQRLKQKLPLPSPKPYNGITITIRNSIATHTFEPDEIDYDHDDSEQPDKTQPEPASAIPIHHHGTRSRSKLPKNQNYNGTTLSKTEASSSPSSKPRRKGQTKHPQWTGEKATLTSLRKQEAEHEADASRRNKRRNRLLTTIDGIANDDDENEPNDEFTASRVWNHLDEIPLGRTGGRIMVTFGDGPRPDPAACAVALSETRLRLQNAIKNARSLCRQTRSSYLHAHAIANLHNTTAAERRSLSSSTVVDQELMYRAIGGERRRVDPVAGQGPPAGFDTEQLKKLFPEEMGVYERWGKMHASFQKKEGATGINKVDRKQEDNMDDENCKNTNSRSDNNRNGDCNDSDDSSIDEPSNNDADPSLWGGHLRTRLSNFDTRTRAMKRRWYVAFAEVRRGSFLSVSNTASSDTSMAEARSWHSTMSANRRRSTGKGGKKKIDTGGGGTWEFLPASHVRFLHWLGFDPRSALPPPGRRTGEALAFLAYDFMGKIIEKAIYLRRTKEGKKEDVDDDRELPQLQLGIGEQLTEKDIRHAVEVSSASVVADSALEDGVGRGEVALYFGPGFEDTIEMEMDRMVSKTKNNSTLSETEQKIRATEEELFAKLRSPPIVLERVLDLLSDAKGGEGHASATTKETNELRAREKEKRREQDEIEWRKLERAAMDQDPMEEVERKEDMKGAKKKKRARRKAVLEPLKKKS